MDLYNCSTIEKEAIRRNFAESRRISLVNKLWRDNDFGQLFCIDTLIKTDNVNSIFMDYPEIYKFRKKNLDNEISTTEIHYENHPDLVKFKDSKILIVGAGGSTNEVDWNSQDYDYIWSCNKFYKSPKLQNTSLVLLGNHPDFKDNRLKDHMKRGMLAIYEPDHSPTGEGFKKFKSKFPNTILAHLRYNGRIGAIPRLVIYAVLWGASQVDIVGMDGPCVDNPKYSTYAFGNEGVVPSQGYIYLVAKNHHEVMSMYHRQYIMLWDYILDYLRPKTKFKNLAENIHGNMLAPISKVRL